MSVNPASHCDQPLTVPLSRAPEMTGISRSGLYRAAAAGHVEFIKLGKTTLVDMASVRAYLASLPRATVKGC